MLRLLLLLSLAYSSNASVILTSSADNVCPGDTVIFACVTDTGRLVWYIKDATRFYSNLSAINVISNTDIFTLKLISVTGSMLISTATAHDVSIDLKVTCSDTPDDPMAGVMKTVKLGPPSPPLNLTFISSPTSPSVTISWVAPQDTPLCVHSYTVTVRNSCNSSQVMVYNTTDNRSSLNITELMADGEYSVTVAGRDGAGQLGEKSDELRISLRDPQVTVQDHTIAYDSVLIKWKLLYSDYYHQLELSCLPLAYYLIRHNVSGDQSPITVNRTNVTLYGVQPGETYYVEITPYVLFRKGELLQISFSVPSSLPATLSPLQPDPSTSNNDAVHSSTICAQGVTTVTVFHHQTPPPLPHPSATTLTMQTPLSLPTPECSGQSVPLWALVVMVVPWVLLGVVVAVVMSCYFNFLIRANPKEKKYTVSEPKARQHDVSIDKENCATKIASSHDHVRVTNALSIAGGEEGGGGGGEGGGEGGGGGAVDESGSYEEVDTYGDTPISMTRNISYFTVAHSSR